VRAIESHLEALGWEAFPFQRRAWEAYAQGRSGLIHAATGTGKTLAAWMGAIQEWLDERDAGEVDPDASPPLRVLWITPLRALAHDTLASLQAPSETLGLPWTIELRTGDVSSSIKARQRRRLPSALVTTPESASVLLSYPESARQMANVRLVVVDEWHELLSTKRGVQIELLLARLRARSPKMRTWGLSATLGNLGEALDTLLGETPKASGVLIPGDVEKRVQIETIRPERVERFPWAGHLGTALLEQTLGAVERAQTTLLFTNTRSQAEIWFRRILETRPDMIGDVALHHGSLDRDVREQVERLLKQGRIRCVVCTSSLDLGVDFWPVDQVIQVGSPRGVARLVQRAGRSGHRPGLPSRVLCVPTNALELAEFAAARDAVGGGQMESRPSVRLALDALVQHLVTVALGGGFEEDRMREEVRSTACFRALTDEQWEWAMEFVQRGGKALGAYPQYARVTRSPDGRCVVSDQRLARMHRMAIGTIPSDGALRVKYLSGRSLGVIEEAFIVRLKPGDRFTFAGRVLELDKVRDMIAWVRRAKTKRGIVPRWMGTKFPLSTQLAEAVQERFEEASRGVYGDAELETLRPLLELQRVRSRIPRPEELLIETTRSREGHHAFLFPFAGRAAHEGLGGVLAHRLGRRAPASLAVTVNDYGLELLCSAPIDLDEQGWRDLLSSDELLDDLLACLNTNQLARSRFRDIARVAGLVFPGYPGMGKTARQLQASSDLFFDVFHDFDPENLLLDQARREVLSEQLEFRRVRGAMEAAARRRIALIPTERLSPLAFPIYAERLRTQYFTTEKWHERVERLASEMEREARRLAPETTDRHASPQAHG